MEKFLRVLLHASYIPPFHANSFEMKGERIHNYRLGNAGTVMKLGERYKESVFML
jgi:hypothetical protein